MGSMARAENVSDDMLNLADAWAHGIKRKYMEAGGSETDWVTDLSFLVAKILEPRVVDLTDFAPREPVEERRGSVRVYP